MLDTVSFLSNSTPAVYTAQTHTAPKVPALLKNVNAESVKQIQDVYQRADGTEAVAKSEVKRPVLDLVSEAKQTKQEKPLSDEDKRFKEVLHQFVGQTLFGQMLKSMRASQKKNPYFDGGRAEEIFQGQLDAVLTDQMTKSTSRSLSDPMYKLMTASKTK
ncbi:hypothetical protein FACS18942_02770 [Planctomycetales bacterium]|nr:hypothetical protein FACS18942_02770 [Planctomycetales bacterium]